MSPRGVPLCLKMCKMSIVKHAVRIGNKGFSNLVDKCAEKQMQNDSSEKKESQYHAPTISQPNRSFVNFSGPWNQEGMANISKDMLIMNDFISEQEEECIMTEIGNYLKRMRYEFDHWDDAIHGFRETERLQWNSDNQRVLDRVRQHAFDGDTLKHVHILDLAATGVIKPHVDSVRFCGSTIAGLSLLSDAVMRLVSTTQPERRLDALLTRRSLYIMRYSARYDYTHEILTGSDSRFGGQPVSRERRVSIICRNEPTASPPSAHHQPTDDDGSPS